MHAVPPAALWRDVLALMVPKDGGTGAKTLILRANLFEVRSGPREVKGATDAIDALVHDRIVAAGASQRLD